MSVKINYSKNKVDRGKANLVLFTNDKYRIDNLKKFFSNSEFSYINDLLKSSDLKKLLIFELSSKKKIVIVSVKDDYKNSDLENLGAEFFKSIKQSKKCEYFIISDSINNKHRNFLGLFFTRT